MIKDEPELEKIRKVYKLILECIRVNDISEADAINAMAYYFIVSAASFKISIERVDELMDFIKNFHRISGDKL